MKILLKIALILVVIVVVVIIGAFASLKYITGALDAKHKSAPQTIAAEQSIGKAMVIYQPSRSDYTKKAAMALAEDLSKKGYDVTVNFPGDDLSKDISGYDILAFGSPVYMDKGSPLVTNYIKRLSGLEGKRVLLFTTGMVNTDKAYDGMNDTLKTADVLKIKFASNKEHDITTLAQDTVDKLCAQK